MRALGSAIAHALLAVSGKALLVAIQGELGAGKTTLVGGILHAMGVTGPAKSPTYTLIEPYEVPAKGPGIRRIYHLDLYRLADPQEVDALGLRDLLTSDAALLVEWPERGAGILPAADLSVTILYPAHGGADLRDMVLEGHGEFGELLMRRILNVR